MSQYTQNDKPMRFLSPLGEDVLLLAKFDGTEAVSRLFCFEVELQSENSGIDFSAIVGKPVSISLKLTDDRKRFFHGIVSRFSHFAGKGSSTLRLSTYRAIVVPWTWLLTRTSDSRIFQNMSVPEIVEKIFKEKGFSDYRIDLQQPYEKRVYCVQYRETDFDFISRLLEDEGIYYYFTHEESKHTMVVGDSPAKHRKIDGRVRYQYSFGIVEEDTITELDKSQEIQAGKYTLNDFNFEMPRTGLESFIDSQQKLGPGEREKYDHPGGYAKKAGGDKLARIRMEEEEARITTISGSGTCGEFTSGYRFTLSDSVRSDMNDKDYLLTSVEHHAIQGWEDDTAFSYANRFACIPYSVPFRPPRTTPKPVVNGSQTATVVGPSSEEIHTDKYGRVIVQFHWDREGKRDEKSSCWIRVGQIWAGQGWGGVWIPRIGHEVVVSFLEGDPDRPLITGSVYNGVNMPPYTLPDEKTKSTVKSNTTKGGGGSNEIRFEDKKGEEQIFVHAQKNVDLTVENDRFETVKHDQHVTVEHDLVEQVKNEHHETVDVHRYTQIGKDYNLDVKGKEARQVGESLSLTVKGDVVEVFKADHSEQTANDYYLKASTVVIEGMRNITLSVGGSYIAIEPGTIEIKTTGQLTIEGTQVSISGSAMAEIKGGMVKLN